MSYLKKCSEIPTVLASLPLNMSTYFSEERCSDRQGSVRRKQRQYLQLFIDTDAPDVLSLSGPWSDTGSGVPAHPRHGEIHWT